MLEVTNEENGKTFSNLEEAFAHWTTGRGTKTALIGFSWLSSNYKGRRKNVDSYG